jgi:hypothetical protein
MDSEWLRISLQPTINRIYSLQLTSLNQAQAKLSCR